MVRGRRLLGERHSTHPAPIAHPGRIVASPHLAAAIDKTSLRVRVRPSQSAITPPPRDTTPILALSAVANRLERPSAARARRPRRGRRTATTRRASSVASRQPLFVPFVSPRTLAFDRAWRVSVCSSSLAPPVGRAPTNRSIDRASSPTPRVRRIDPRLVRDHVREFVRLSRAFARRLDRSPLRRPSLPRLRRRRRRILPRSPRSPTLVARAPPPKNSPPKVSTRVFSSVAPARRLVVASRLDAPPSLVTHPSQPSPARGCRAVDGCGSNWMLKNIHVFSVGHDSSTRPQSRSSTRHRRDARVGAQKASV